MYPTVSALMQLWPFVIGGGFTSVDATAETQAFLNEVTLGDLRKTETWRSLRTLVRIRAESDLLPVRARYNLAEDGSPVLRKACAHGLGHLREPYSGDEATDIVREPIHPLAQIGVARWQHDLLIRIIQASLRGTPNQVPLDYHPAFQRPCVSRYGATSPRLLKWVDTWNQGKPYDAQIKPFGFLMSFAARAGLFAAHGGAEIIDPLRCGRPKKRQPPKPIGPFDRITGRAVHAEKLKTYAEALAVGLIGKEANKVGSSGEADPVAATETVYRGSGSKPDTQELAV